MCTKGAPLACPQNPPRLPEDRVRPHEGVTQQGEGEGPCSSCSLVSSSQNLSLCFTTRVRPHLPPAAHVLLPPSPSKTGQTSLGQHTASAHGGPPRRESCMHWAAWDPDARWRRVSAPCKAVALCLELCEVLGPWLWSAQCAPPSSTLSCSGTPLLSHIPLQNSAFLGGTCFSFQFLRRCSSCLWVT